MRLCCGHSIFLSFVLRPDNGEAGIMSQPIYNIRASFLKIVYPQQVVPYGLYGDSGGTLVVLMWRP